MKEVNKNRKDEILSHHTEVDIDEIWAAIEPQLDLINAEKKRKKYFFLFFLFGAFLLTSGALYMWQTGTSVALVNNTIEAEINDTGAIIKEAQTYLKEKLTEASSNVQTTDNQTIENTPSTTRTKDLQLKTTSSTATKSVGTYNNKVVNKVIPSAFTKSKNTTNNSNKIANLNQQINTNKQAVSPNEIIFKEAFSNQKNPENNGLDSITISPQIPALKLVLPNSMPDVREVDIAEADDELPGGKLSFALAANTGISFINRGLASNINEESSSEVLRLRRASETPLEAIHYGLRAKLTHKSGFSFNTGAQYTILSERYENNNLEIESDSIQGIIKRIIQLNGDTVDVIGLMPRTTTYNYEKEIYNRYKMIDIPFIIGFESGMEKWSLGIQAGVFLNLALKTSGQIRNTLTEDLNIGDNQSDVFKSKVGLSYYGGIYVRRALSQNLDITIAPHGRFFAKDFNVSSYAVKQKYSLIGVQAGFSYRFGH